MNGDYFQNKDVFFLTYFLKHSTRNAGDIWEKYNKFSQNVDNNFLEKINITMKYILLGPLQTARNKIKKDYITTETIKCIFI